MTDLSRTWHSVRALWSDGRGWILTFVALGWLLTIGTRYVFPALFPHLRAALGFDLSTLGLLYTLLWAAYAVGQFPAGLVSDRIGTRRVLSYSAFLTAVSLLFIGATTSPPAFVVGMIVFGATSSLYGPARFTVLARVYPERSGTAIGLTQACGQFGNTILPAVSGIAATVLVWQVGFLYIVPLYVLVGLGLWRALPDPDRADKRADSALAGTTSVRDIAAASCFPTSLALTGVLTVTMFVIQGLTGFYPTYLVEAKDLAPSTAAWIFALMFVSAGVTQPLAGAVNDRVGTQRTLSILVIVLALSLPLITVATTISQFVVVTALLGGSLFGISPITITRLTNLLPSDIRGSGLGLLRTVYFLVGSTGSFVVGQLAEAGLFDESFFLFTLLAGVILVLLFAFRAVSD